MVEHINISYIFANYQIVYLIYRQYDITEYKYNHHLDNTVLAFTCYHNAVSKKDDVQVKGETNLLDEMEKGMI